MKSYIIQQKITPLANQYAVYESTDGQQGPQPDKMVAFAQQKRLALKEKFTMYADDSKQTILFEMQARQVFDFSARYEVRDANGTVLGVLGKNFKASLLNSTWHMYQPGKEETPQLVVRERNQTLAIVRRIWELLPVIGDIPFFVKFHFDFTDPTTNKVVAGYNKTTTLRDHYQLEIHDEAEALFDWRVYVALGIALDAMQSR